MTDYTRALTTLPQPTVRGWRSSPVAKAAGVTYRQLDFWATKGWAPPTWDGDGKGGSGSGIARLYDLTAATRVACIARLSQAGMRPKDAAAALDGHPLPDGVTVAVDVGLIRTQTEAKLAEWAQEVAW